MRAPLGSLLGRHLVAALAALSGVVALQGSADAASCIPGFDYGAFGVNELKFGGGAFTNSYDSSGGAYPSGVLASGGDIGTNADCATSSGASTINGTVIVGEGTTSCPTSPAQVPQGTGSEPTFPGVTIPAPNPIGVLRPLVVAAGAATVTTVGGNWWGPLQGAGASVDITVVPGTYVVNYINLKGKLKVSGPTVIYLQCSGGGLDFTGGSAEIVSSTGKATDLLLMAVSPGCDGKAFTINGGASSAFALYAPYSDVTINGSADIFGSIVGKSVKFLGGAKIHYDRALKNTEVGSLKCAAVEISRASPIIATVGTDELMIQGTYESPIPATRPQVLAATDLATFEFPYIQGHLRARKISLLTAVQNFNAAGVSKWDGAGIDLGVTPGGIPPVTLLGCASNYTPYCRTVFTNAATGFNPANVVFKTAVATVATLAPLLKGSLTLTAAEDLLLVTKILKGGPGGTPRLGGLDRSTVAVIPSSLIAGSSRPTMVYVGGTDGMLHAFCAHTFKLAVEAFNYCEEGKELWAFAPRTLLPSMRFNNAIIDGSPRVVDMFGDFDGNGTGEFRTILTFITGAGQRTAGQTPAVYALDITEPRDPKVVWEYTWNPSSVRAHELGQGQTLAQTVISVGGVKKNVVYAQTNNGQSLADAASAVGSGAPGTVLVALNVDTGTELFAPVGYNYTDPPRGAGTAVPYTGVPGGAVSVEVAGSGFTDALVFGTLYGEMWVVDPSTGASKYGTSPLFRFTTNGKPVGAAPAIYKDAGVSYAVGVTGAYWDRSGSSAWGTAATQHGFAVRLGLPSTATVPFTESDAGSTNVPFVANFTGGKKLGAQALVVGNEVFFTAETSNINSTGYASTATPTGSVESYNVTNGSSVNSDTTVIAGVGSLAKAADGSVYASGARGSEKLYNASVTGGQKVAAGSPKLTRRLWLRTL